MRMRKKILALITAAVLVLSLCPTALAEEEEDGVRETSFFTDENKDRRTDMTFDELAEYLFDWYDNDFDFQGGCVPLGREILALAEDEANAGSVKAKLLELDDAYINCRTVGQIGGIRYWQTWEEDYYSCKDESYADSYDVWCLLVGLCGKLQDTPCAGVLEELFPKGEDLAYYADNADWTLESIGFYAGESGGEDGAGDAGDGEDAGEDGYVDPYTADSDLRNEYYDRMYDEFTTTYEGEEWTEDDVYAAWQSGEIDDDTYTKLYREIGKSRNEVLGGLFVESLPYRQQIAEEYGYANYMENCYDYIYARDYTYEEIQAFSDALKTYIVPVYQAVSQIPLEYGDAFYADYAGDAGLDLVEPCLGKISSELLESFTYMREHGMADTDWSDYKGMGSNATIPLYGFGTGYILSDPAMAYSDNQLYNFDMIVHEFGHFNGNYWNGCTGGFFDYINKPDYQIDVCEVQSQGLELLMLKFYPEIFGDEAEDVALNRLYGLLYTLLYEAECNEFETYAYTTPGVTLQQLNEKWLQLGIAYGFVSPDTPYTENYSWVTNSQLMDSPGYSISYSVSLAGAFTFWRDAQEDYFAGADEYLEFCALPAELSFQESFEAMEMENPLSADYVQALGEMLGDAVAEIAAERAPAEEDDAGSGPLFSDVEGRWFEQAVLALAGEGLVSGYEDGAFHPDEAATYGMISPDADNADTGFTRLEVCYMLAEDLEWEEGASSPFSDTDDAVVAALAAMGIIGGYADGTFRPDAPMTRAEFCVVWYRALCSAGRL